MAKTKKELEELEEEEDEALEDESDDEDYEDEDYEDEDDEDEEDDEDQEAEDEDYDEEDYDEEDDAAFAGPEAEADPYWWTPHLVLGVLLLVALLGFFGAFNPWLGHLAPPPAEHVEVVDAPAAPATAAPAPAAPAATPAQRPQVQEIFGARHILVQFEGARKAPATMKRSKDEAKKIAADAAAKAKKTTTAENRAEAWKAIAIEHDDPNAEKTGGDLGLFRPGAYDEAFVAAVRKMKVGDVSDPVETQFGYHVIWRTR